MKQTLNLKRRVRKGIFAFSSLIIGGFLFVLSGCAIAPQPFTSQEIKDQVLAKRQNLFAHQEPTSNKITLYEAMARAVAYNLDYQVKHIEQALARGNLDQARYELLPQLVASMRYSERNNQNGSSSKSLLSGVESSEVSTSQEKQQFTADIIYVWNVLDFGVGYMQAQQMADEVLISGEWRRKAIQNIVQNVRYAYWKAARAEKLLPEMDTLLQTVEKALDRSREMKKNRVQNPAKILTYQQELLETVKLLWAMRKELSLAKIELAALMNMDPGVDLELDFTDVEQEKVQQILSIDSLEEFALAHRPEIWIESYNQRISSQEVKKAMLSMLPGLEINLNANYDSNRFFLNNSWLQAGLSLSWNVFNLLSGQKALETANIQQKLADKLYMATAMMVLTQVHLAHQGYYLALKDFQIATQLDMVLQKKLWHAQAAKRALAGSEQEVIRNQVAALSAKMNQGLAYAELQGAIGKIFNTAGMDLLPARINVENIQTLARFIEGYEQGLLAKLQVQSDSPGESEHKKIKIPLSGKERKFQILQGPEKIFVAVKPIIEEPVIESAAVPLLIEKKVLPKPTPEKIQPKMPLTPVVSEEQQKQYRKAYQFFFDLFIKTPQSRNVNFLLGKSAYGMGDYEAAIMAFERILIIEPSAMEIMFEIAKSYAALGSYRIATEYISEVLEADTPQNVFVQAKNMLEQIQAASTGE
ncbi:MAG: TolC family protein [Desulfobacula sp.]|nr:TolC family protein [Desulfobacula sp.]